MRGVGKHSQESSGGVRRLHERRTVTADPAIQAGGSDAQALGLADGGHHYGWSLGARMT